MGLVAVRKSCSNKMELVEVELNSYSPDDAELEDPKRRANVK